MTDETRSAELFAAIAQSLVSEPDVTLGASGKKGFGSSALQIRGKIFAMIDSLGNFVVKLPRPRVDALVAAGEGRPYDPGHGRIMREWVVVEPASPAVWSTLASEAMAYVGSQS
jgi:hypothetical protein